MLQPSNRLTLIDAMRPPQGYGLDAAMAVTFTLDLRALLAAPMAFALGAADATDEETPQNEPIELLHALRTHSRKLTIFSQAGEIALPPSRRVFAFLEQAVVPVSAPRGGVVHPKVWVLRYQNLEDESEQRLRVLIASRNLTFDESWDTVVRLDEVGDQPGTELAPVGELFEGLAKASSTKLAKEHRHRVSSLSDALSEVRFALPSGVDDMRIHVLGLSPVPSPLPTDQDRSLIISPFLGDDFFTTIHPETVDELVSRPESFDSLKPSSLEHAVSTFAFDDGSAVELDGSEERLTGRDPGQPLVGLHAKVFAFEKGRQAKLFFGSANATGAAFTSNVEILVEMIGSVERLGIDRLCEGTDDEPGLRALFATYSKTETASDDETTSGLDAARLKIATLGIEGFVEESGSGWAVTYRSTSEMPSKKIESIYCWPLASHGNRRQATTGEVLDVRFETTIEAISGFLAFEISDDQECFTKFVVPVPLVGVPEHRERLLLRALIGNAERFLRYLLALLDEDSEDLDLTDLVDATEAEGGSEVSGSFSLPVLEKLLRTMRRDPAKLAGIHPLVSDLAADDALPDGFAELWTLLFEVAITGDKTS